MLDGHGGGESDGDGHGVGYWGMKRGRFRELYIMGSPFAVCRSSHRPNSGLDPDTKGQNSLNLFTSCRTSWFTSAQSSRPFFFSYRMHSHGRRIGMCLIVYTVIPDDDDHLYPISLPKILSDIHISPSVPHVD